MTHFLNLRPDIEIPRYENWCRVPIDKINSSSVVYNFGVGESIAFEYILSGLKSCSIYHFDPTPRSAIHFELCQKLLQLPKEEHNMFIKKHANSNYGGGNRNYLSIISESNARPDKQHFFDFGLYDKDT
jgi:hypothetical protein